MLKKRIIPKLLIKYEKFENKYTPVCVTTKNYNKINFVGDPISQGKIFESQLADEIVLLNYERISLKENKIYFDFLKDFSSNIFLPLTAGGGIKTLKDNEMYLKNGADKILINSITGVDKSFVKKAARNFGKQCIVVAIDFRSSKENEIYIERGKSKINMDILSWAKTMQEFGAGEIILTDIDRDGCRSGLNIQVGKNISENLEIPVVLSGGCGLAEHFVEGFKKTKIQGISAGTFFSYRDQNFFETRSQILNNKINLR